MLWLLTVDLLVAGWAVYETLGARIDGFDLIRCAVLALGATVYVVATREPEERRRDADRRGEHVDQTSIWIFAGAVVLPVPLTVFLVLLVRAQRYRIARKPPSTYLFTTAAITASALGVHAISVLTPLHRWMSGTVGWPRPVGDGLVTGMAVVTAVTVYFLMQAVLVGVARALINRDWSVVAMLGDYATNKAILVALVLAVCTSVLQAFSILLGLFMALIAVQWTRREQQFAQSAAERERLVTDALHDPLTGLPNRRGWSATTNLALISDQGHQRPTALLFCDLDLFKRWNAELGHVSADEILKAVAGVLRAQTRPGDVLCRWGGEELAVLLPDTELTEAEALAERIRAAVASIEVEVTLPSGGAKVRVGPGNPAGRRTVAIVDGQGCTVSIGVAASPWHGTEVRDLEVAAAQAMKRAKDTGRNQVALADGTPLVTVEMSRQSEAAGAPMPTRSC